MLVRPLSARQGILLPRLNTTRRPQLIARNPSPHSLYIPNRRVLTTAPAEPLTRRRRDSVSKDPHTTVPKRSLATAMTNPIRQDEIRFDQYQSHISHNYSSPLTPRLYDIRPFDPSSPLLINRKDDIPFPRSRMNTNGIPGGLDEMLSVFDACLHVGKLDRAALVLLRFGDMDVLAAHDLIALHNQYLRVAMNKAFDEPDPKWAQSLHRWFEVHIRGKRIPHNAETIACMLKIALLSSQGERLERLVARYMDLMPGDAIYSVLSQDEILSQQDLGVITSIYKPASDLLEEFEPVAEETEETEAMEKTEKTDTSLSQSTTTTGTKPEVDNTPEILAVPQKGLGLKSLRGVLSFFADIENQDLSTLPMAERREIQSRLEKDCVEAAIARWREENKALLQMGLNNSLSTNALSSQLYEWQQALESKLDEEFALFDQSEAARRKGVADHDRCVYAPFLRLSNPTRLAAVTIISVLNAISTTGADKGVQLSNLLTLLSKGVEDDIKFLIRQKQNPLFYNKHKSGKRVRKTKKQQAKEAAAAAAAAAAPGAPGAPGAQPDVEVIEDATGTPVVRPKESTEMPANIIESTKYETKSWPLLIKTKVGVVLLSALMETAKVKVVREHSETKALVGSTQPALTHTTIYRKGKKVGLVMPNKFLVELLKREPPGDFLARHLPMLVEPEPWTKFDKGGFLEFPSQLVRVKNGEKDQKIYSEAAVERGDMEQVSKGLDVLGRTSWRINKPVFDVMLKAWNTGKEIANIPPLDPDLPIPAEPTSDDPLTRRTWLKAVKAIENEKSGLHSERCFMNFQLEIARAFKNQTFYFPHNMDFRGRAYPLPTYLNHMGADHVRGLLRFAEGKELGDKGLRWLKVHLANVFGYDKASLSEREAFAMEHLEDIYDSANNPLTGKQWWLKAEESWQCLAACYELKAALESPDPTKYVSHLPVHQDGTCNGLQHYAALGGDSWGAQQVNLEPGDRPADVYSAVAELVKESIAEDLKTDNTFAKAVDGKITRKVVKQTVMTNVYGVTFMGAKAQVQKQLEAAYPNIQKDTEIPPNLLASYIATKIFKALSTMFRGAHDIQFWLGECAGRICRALTPEQMSRISKGDDKPILVSSTRSRSVKKEKPIAEQILSQLRSTVVWTTPLRMPVVQPYRKSGTRIIETSMQDLTLQVPERSDPVNRRKQLQAFPPNFIHSLDASHMLLSALECDELGLSFAAVHDSFWTHAADVDIMNRVLRDCFIRIHSEDVIKRLASEFEARYKGALYLTKIDRKSAAGDLIYAHRKTVKRNLKEELLVEYERLQLLLSKDPEQVKKGKKMVTPASIFEDMAASQPLSSTEDMEAVGLGNIPAGNNASGAAVADDLMHSGEPAGLDVSKVDDVDDHDNGDDDADPSLMKELETNRFESSISLQKQKKAAKVKEKATKNRVSTITLWLPLTFPEVPEKGEFDVGRLKDSQYFFS